MFGYWQQAMEELQETVSLRFNPKPPDLPAGYIRNLTHPPP